LFRLFWICFVFTTVLIVADKDESAVKEN
jgi:hypothetical protein